MGKDSYQQRISACLPEQSQQVHGIHMDHASLVRQPRTRISVYVLENLKEGRNDLLPAGHGLGNEVVGERSAVPVEMRKKLVNLHDGFQTTISGSHIRIAK